MFSKKKRTKKPTKINEKINIWAQKEKKATHLEKVKENKKKKKLSSAKRKKKKIIKNENHQVSNKEKKFRK